MVGHNVIFLVILLRAKGLLGGDFNQLGGKARSIVTL